MEKSTQRIRVAIVDNDRMALMALSSLMTREGFAVIWTVQLGAAAIQRCIPAQDRPDALLVDMALSDMTGIDVCRSVHKWAPRLAMIGVTAYDPDVYRAEALAAGAITVISKDRIADMAQEIRTAAKGRDGIRPVAAETQPRTGTISDTSLVNAASPAYGNGQDPAGQVASDDLSVPRSFALSAQQTEIMRRYAEGRSTDEIAAALGVSKGTIFAQVARVRDKLHARDRNEAVALCRRFLRM